MSQDELFDQAMATYDSALERLVCAYEADPGRRGDLLQEIRLALWRSFARFEGRCSLATWVFRVAHNAAASYVIRQRRANLRNLLTLEEAEALPDQGDHERDAGERIALDRLLRLIHRLKPIDRQLMLLYLEDLDAPAIGEITGISAGNVRVHLHRIRKILGRQFHEGGES